MLITLRVPILEVVITAIAKLITEHRDDIGNMTHGLVYSDNIKAGDNSYTYYMHVYGHGLRECLLLKNATLPLREAITSQATEDIHIAASNDNDYEGCFQDQEPSVKLVGDTRQCVNDCNNIGG